MNIKKCLIIAIISLSTLGAMQMECDTPPQSNIKNDVFSVFNAHTWSWANHPSEGDLTAFNAQKYWKKLPFDIQRSIATHILKDDKYSLYPFVLKSDDQVATDLWLPCSDTSSDISYKEIGFVTKILKTHTNKINSLALHPTGEYLLSASDDKTARIWNMKTAQCIAVLPVDLRCRVRSAQWNQNGTRIRTIDFTGKERQWDFTSEIQGDYNNFSLEQALFIVLFRSANKPVDFKTIDRRVSHEYIEKVFNSFPEIAKNKMKSEGIK